MHRQDSFVRDLTKDVYLQIETVRTGISADAFRGYFPQLDLSLSDVLKNLKIAPSTFFKDTTKPLNPEISGKLLRFLMTCELVQTHLEGDFARWLVSPAPVLNNCSPLSLLDTEPGSRLVEQTILQIRSGIYG
jgi:putative toxin-antitoxin system antitoxin component (TIGR02293 family)